VSDPVTLGAALLLGLVASGHCILMCGGITAALGFIPPWLAAIGMSTSSLFVVLNALRIGREPSAPAAATIMPAAPAAT